ncbi:MAG: Spo0E family sporulation regulatory protein-aspartic acid phosphatase [Lachnospiraceae bacterium]|nr:Spo0E family sporulation regulatory protein-aspartic acid phosphatase [Lachnospiraceae bacterium]
MNKKEFLEQRIEEERILLNALFIKNSRSEETYRQSLVLDGLIERYLEQCEKMG